MRRQWRLECVLFFPHISAAKWQIVDVSFFHIHKEKFDGCMPPACCKKSKEKKLRIDSEIDRRITRFNENNSLLYKNQVILDSLTVPFGAEIIGRENKIDEILRHLMPAGNEALVVPFISCYGKSGTGKSTIVKIVCKKLQEYGVISSPYAYVNLRKAATIFGCANLILKELGGTCLKSAGGIAGVMERIELAIENMIIVNQSTARKEEEMMV
jgi:hypothetical protein